MQLTRDTRMQTEGNANHFVSIGLNFGITMLCIFPTWIVLSEMDGSHETPVNEEHVVVSEKKLEADA